MSDMAISHNDHDHPNERPAKKRRFFVEDENGASHALDMSQQDTSSQADYVNDGENDIIDKQPTEATAVHQDDNEFDAQLMSIVGQDVPETTIAKIRQAAGGIWKELSIYS